MYIKTRRQTKENKKVSARWNAKNSKGKYPNIGEIGIELTGLTKRLDSIVKLDDQKSIDETCELIEKITHLDHKAIASKIRYKRVKTSTLVKIATYPRYFQSKWKGLALLRESSMKNAVESLQKIWGWAEDDSPLQCNVAFALGFLGSQYSVWPMVEKLHELSELQRERFTKGLEKAHTALAIEALKSINNCYTI
jgi:hypothetical protein